MDLPAFWSIIEYAAKKGRGDQDAMLEALSSHLATLPPEHIAAFKQVMDELMHKAYTWELWGAAYIMNGGCSDDGFEYFRAWLLAQGRVIFDAAVRDPETLASAKLKYGEEGEFEFEPLLYTPMEVYKELTGAEMPRPAASADRPSEPRGQRWEEDSDDLETRFPKLWKKFAD
jgi:hypothetical protein